MDLAALLPCDLLRQVLAFLPCPLRAAARVSNAWHALATQDAALWRIICERDWGPADSDRSDRHRNGGEEDTDEDEEGDAAGAAISRRLVPLARARQEDSQVLSVAVPAATYRAAWTRWAQLFLSIGGAWADLTGGGGSTAAAAFRSAFLDLAASWRRVLAWDKANMPCLLPAAAAGPAVRLGSLYMENAARAVPLATLNLHPSVLAWFCCADGQARPARGELSAHTCGQVGGFQVYGEYHCAFLATLNDALGVAENLDLDAHQLLPVTVPFGTYQPSRLWRIVCVHRQDAHMVLVTLNRQGSEMRFDNMRATLVQWWATFSRRLTTGYYALSPHVFGRDHPGRPGIDLFPRRAPACMSATTHGVRVEASTIWSGDETMGFTYSIRLKLVDPAALLRKVQSMRALELVPAPEMPGAAAAASTSVGIQLVSRHWVIVHTGGGDPRHVRGPGVVGNFPILMDGGYINVTERGGQEPFTKGWFMYQSFSGQMPTGGSFGGDLTFKINMLGGADNVVSSNGFPDNIGGAHLQVTVPTFALPTPQMHQGGKKMRVFY